MSIRVKSKEIKISPFIVLIPLVLAFTGHLIEYFIALFSIALHEAAHVLAAKLFGYRADQIKITPAGFSVTIDTLSCSEAVSIFICLAGPIANLLIYAAAEAAFHKYGSMNLTGSFYGLSIRQFLQVVSATNLFFALFNLMPALPLDGGRILYEILAARVGLSSAEKILKRLSVAFSIILLLIGAYQFYISLFNFSLIIIGICIIILVDSRRMESALLNIRQILYRRNKLEKRGIYPARPLVVLKSTRLNEAIKNMDFDMFHIVYVLDDDLRLKKALTENEIMDAIAREGENITFGMLLEKRAKYS